MRTRDNKVHGVLSMNDVIKRFVQEIKERKEVAWADEAKEVSS